MLVSTVVFGLVVVNATVVVSAVVAVISVVLIAVVVDVVAAKSRHPLQGSNTSCF